jgi:cysteine desulfurase/selenocysteine lyase
MINWDEIRQLHLGECEGTYLNSPANGLPSIANEAFVADEIGLFRAAPGKYRINFITNAIPAIKQLIADLLNSKSSEIALVPNFSIGLNLFVQSLPKKSKVLVIKDDYPSLTSPFEVNDFEMVWTTFEEDKTLDLAQLEVDIIKHKPDIVAISHCQWLSGYLADLESIGALCKEHNCLFLVDATQSFGAIPIDVRKCNISVLGASCYKWALAGFGNGFLYVNEKILSNNKPKSAGFNSYDWDGLAMSYTPSMRSYEPGHHDHVAFHRLGFALQSIKEIGQDFIHLRITELMDYLIEQLTEASISIVGNFHDENRLGIITIPSQPGLFKYLLSRGIEVSERGGNIRLGVHYYNNEEDVDVFVREVLTFLS